mgnify:CR=1 FL=1
MDTIKSLHQRILVISSLLDTTAAEIRDIPLMPVSENIHHIGKALSELYDLLRAIHAVRPDLVPSELDERNSDKEANRRLTCALANAHDLARSGNINGSINILLEYESSETSLLHKAIALEEVNHLKSLARP